MVSGMEMLADAEGGSMLPETTDAFLQEEAWMSEAVKGNLPAKTPGSSSAWLL